METAGFDALEEIAQMRLAVLADQAFRLCVGQVFDTLLGAEVELHPGALVLRADHFDRS